MVLTEVKLSKDNDHNFGARGSNPAYQESIVTASCAPQRIGCANILVDYRPGKRGRVA